MFMDLLERADPEAARIVREHQLFIIGIFVLIAGVVVLLFHETMGSVIAGLGAVLALYDMFSREK